MNQQAMVEILIGCVTVLLSVIGSAVVIGMFFGGLKAEMRIMSDRLAKIEGMFTLVPRQDHSKSPD